MSILFFLFLLKTILFYSFFLFSVLWDFRKKSLPKLLLLFYSLVGIPFFLFSLWQDFFQGPFQLSLPFLYSFYPFLFSFLIRTYLFGAGFHASLSFLNKDEKKLEKYVFPLYSLFYSCRSLFLCFIIYSPYLNRKEVLCIVLKQA